MAKKYQIQVQLDDADAERKLRALAGLFGNVDRAARGFADRASKAARDAAGGPGMAATVAKTSQQFRDLGRSFAATHTAFAGLNDDARKFGAAFVQVVNTQVGPGRSGRCGSSTAYRDATLNAPAGRTGTGGIARGIG